MPKGPTRTSIRNRGALAVAGLFLSQPGAYSVLRQGLSPHIRRTCSAAPKRGQSPGQGFVLIRANQHFSEMTGIDTPPLAGLLLLAALIAATDLYLVLIRRRERGRRDQRQAQADHEAGLRGLVRVGLADGPRSTPTSSDRARRSSRWVQRWRGMSSASATTEQVSSDRERVQPPADQ